MESTDEILFKELQGVVGPSPRSPAPLRFGEFATGIGPERLDVLHDGRAQPGHT